jgi:hypothetical protein
MTAPNHTPTDPDPGQPAVIAVLETLSELADLVHRRPLAMAAVKHESITPWV